MKKILIIDDSPTIRKVVKAKVEKMGLAVVGTAADGEEGIRMFQEQAPDLVLLDLTMPNMDGRKCLEEIRRIDGNARVMILSAILCPEVEADCLQRGAACFVSKNNLFTTDILESRILEAMGRAALPAAA